MTAKQIVCAIMVLCLPSHPCPGRSTAHGEHKNIIGSVDFFGSGHVSRSQLASRLPFSAGSIIVKDLDTDYGRATTRVTTALTGHPPSDLTAVCCDELHHYMVYVGIAEDSQPRLLFRKTPRSPIVLTAAELALYHAFTVSYEKAILAGRSREDWSKGYPLSADPRSRRLQLRMHGVAGGRLPMLERVLKTARDPQQRAISAFFIGYSSPSNRQASALFQALTDEESEVRNNALRSLWVLASSGHKLSIADYRPISHLLASPRWSDRNKASLLLEAMSRDRNDPLLMVLKNENLCDLLQGAQWKNPGHASPFLLILGRLEGLADNAIEGRIASDRTSLIMGIKHAMSSTTQPCGLVS